MWAEKVIADVTIKGVSDELADYVTDSGRRHDPGDPSFADGLETLAREHESLGEKVYSFALSNYNRLVAYARTEMGNHRLEEHPVAPNTMAAAFRRFGAKVRAEESGWAKWVPIETSSITIHVPSSSQHMNKEDWERASRFVNSGEEPSLFNELLAGAHTLAVKQHRRNALTEAVTALEAAVAGFVRALEADGVYRSRFAQNVASAWLRERLSERTAHSIGLTKTMKQLLPSILTEEQMPKRLLSACREAVKHRNSVVHGGQRDVNPQELDLFLDSITEMCFLLENQRTMIDPCLCLHRWRLYERQSAREPCL